MVGLFRACLCVFLRVVDAAEQITELGRLTRALVRFPRRRWRLPGPIGRFRRGENKGRFARMAWSLNRIATTDLRAAISPPSGASFERFEHVGVVPGRATKSPGKVTKATLPTWHPVQCVCCCRYFLRLRGQFCRKNNPRGPVKVALRADFCSATGSSLVCGQLRRENDHGNTAVIANSLTRCAGVGLFRLLGDGRWGTTRRRRLRRSALLNVFASVASVRLRGRRRRGNNRGDTADTASLLNYCAGVGLRCAMMKTTTGHIAEAAFPERRLVGLFRACLRFTPRVVNSAERITELGRLTRAVARFLRHPWRLLGPMGRFRRSENQGDSAQMAWSLTHIATTNLRAALI